MQVRWQVPRRRVTTSHNRTLSCGSTRSETAYFGGWKKFFTLWPTYKSLPQLLGQDFDVNFATYTRVYTVVTAKCPVTLVITPPSSLMTWSGIAWNLSRPKRQCTIIEAFGLLQRLQHCNPGLSWVWFYVTLWVHVEIISGDDCSHGILEHWTSITGIYI